MLCVLIFPTPLAVWFTLPIASLQSERLRSSFLGTKRRKFKRGVSIHPAVLNPTGGKFQHPRKDQGKDQGQGPGLDLGRHDHRSPTAMVERSLSVEQRRSPRGGTLDRTDLTGFNTYIIL